MARPDRAFGARVDPGRPARRRSAVLYTVAFGLVAVAAVGVLAWGVVSVGPRHGLTRLTWAPPALRHPITVHVDAEHRYLQLDPDRDYRIVLDGRPLVGPGGLVIQGGHNVVIIGGEIRVPRPGPGQASLYRWADARRGLYLSEQTGTVHVEGLLIDGDYLGEGIDLQEHHGATVEIENVRIDQVRAIDEVHFTDNHPDLVQTWAGPAALRIDGLTGRTDYQALFLAPRQFGPDLSSLDLRHVNVVGTLSCQCILLWDLSAAQPQIHDVWVAPNPLVSLGRSLWPRAGAWAQVRKGTPTGGDFVPEGVPGVNYTSPGYSQ